MKKLIIASFMLLFIVSCKKKEDITPAPPAGLGGNATLTAFTKHHDRPIPSATVFIKYGTSEFPGADTTKYDSKLKVKLHPGTDPHCEFEGLQVGKYYLYAVGYDSVAVAVVKGGLPVEITAANKDGETVVTVSITE